MTTINDLKAQQRELNLQVQAQRLRFYNATSFMHGLAGFSSTWDSCAQCAADALKNKHEFIAQANCDSLQALYERETGLQGP